MSEGERYEGQGAHVSGSRQHPKIADLEPPLRCLCDTFISQPSSRHQLKLPTQPTTPFQSEDPGEEHFDIKEAQDKGEKRPRLCVPGRTSPLLHLHTATCLLANRLVEQLTITCGHVRSAHSGGGKDKAERYCHPHWPTYIRRARADQSQSAPAFTTPIE